MYVCFKYTEINKVLTKIAKEKDCSSLDDWITPCQNHFLWSATSTSSGDGNLILAKFKSFLYHIVNKHKDLPIPLFNKCAHGDIAHRRWLDEGMTITLILFYNNIKTTF